jgi:hypothetical protein
VSDASTIFGINRRPLQVGFNSAMSSSSSSALNGQARGGFNNKKKNKTFAGAAASCTDLLRGGDGGGGTKAGVSTSKPPAFLKWAYRVCGLATTAAWSTIVYTTIRSNQPPGMVMPNFQHGFFARMGALSAVSLMVGSFSTLSSCSNSDSWEQLSSPTCRRQNLAIAAAGVGSALWVAFAPIITQIPGTVPLVSHQAYSGVLRAALIGAYGSAATLSAAVWARSLLMLDDGNNEARQHKPLTWPGRVADGVAQSLVSLAPVDKDDPVNVKYSLLASGFLFFTGLQLVGQHPTTVIPSWTARRLARAFPAWTLLAAVACYDLKEAAESSGAGGGNNNNNNKLHGPLAEEYRNLSNGVKGFGTIYLGARFGAVFLDPSWPASYHAVTQVPGWAAAAILLMGLTLRSDKQQPGPFRAETKHAVTTIGSDDVLLDDDEDDTEVTDLTSSSAEKKAL